MTVLPLSHASTISSTYWPVSWGLNKIFKSTLCPEEIENLRGNTLKAPTMRNSDSYNIKISVPSITMCRWWLHYWGLLTSWSCSFTWKFLFKGRRNWKFPSPPELIHSKMLVFSFFSKQPPQSSSSSTGKNKTKILINIIYI